MDGSSASPPGSSPAGPAPRLLGPGSRGPLVRELQRQLVRLGETIDDPAGSYGAGTEAAVRAFQRRLPWRLPDGLADGGLRSSLARAVRARQGEGELTQLAAGDRSLPLDSLHRWPALVAALQARLRGLGLHPGSTAVDGEPSPTLWKALVGFRRLAALRPADRDALEPADAAALLKIRWLPAVLRGWGARDAHLAFLDRGPESSPWLEQLADPVLPSLASLPIEEGAGYAAYPPRGVLPAIADGGLEWLGPEIGQACLCLGRRGRQGLQTLWLGRDVLSPLECLSATKMVPLLNVLARSDRQGARLQPWGSDALSLDLERVLFDVVSYAGTVGSSNALAALLNQLEPRREAWIRAHTGGPQALCFGGRYGETPPIAQPQLRAVHDDTILVPFGTAATSGNKVSVYDLTRLLSMLGWHRLLGPAQRLRGLDGGGARLAARALSCDTARYLDAAFADLGLERRVHAPLILSKMGYGESALVYSAFLHVRDRRDEAPITHSLAFTLRCPKRRGDREAVRADLAMAEAVSTLLERVLAGRVPAGPGADR